MQTLRGKVSGIRHTIDVSGRQGAVMTTHIAIFNLDGKPVRLEGDATAIDDGDDIEVAGDYNGGIFHALAYRNHSRQTTGHVVSLSNTILVVSWLFGAVFFLIGGVLMVDLWNPARAILGIAFTGAGLALFFKAAKIRRTRMSLRNLRW